MDSIVTQELPPQVPQREPSDAEVQAAREQLAHLAAESLRAQAVLLRGLGRTDDARRLIDDALQLAPDHPALLKLRIESAERDGDRPLTADLLLRAAGATRDPVYRAQLLRRAVLLLGSLRNEAGAQPES